MAIVSDNIVGKIMKAAGFTDWLARTYYADPDAQLQGELLDYRDKILGIPSSNEPFRNQSKVPSTRKTINKPVIVGPGLEEQINKTLAQTGSRDWYKLMMNDIRKLVEQRQKIEQQRRQLMRKVSPIFEQLYGRNVLRPNYGGWSPWSTIYGGMTMPNYGYGGWSPWYSSYSPYFYGGGMGWNFPMMY